MKTIKITENQLKNLIEQMEQLSVNVSQDKGSYMAKQQLYIISIMAMKMWESMEDDTQLEDWMESKIAQAEQTIVNVVKSYMYDEFVDDKNKGTKDINLDDIVIGN